MWKLKQAAVPADQRKHIMGKSGTILYDQLGTERFGYYCPLGLNGWTIVNIVPKDVITAKTDMLTKELMRTGIGAIIIF